MEMCLCSDVLFCKLPAVLRCVAALLAVPGEAGGTEGPCRAPLDPRGRSSSSLFSTGFLLFYGLAMADRKSVV